MRITKSYVNEYIDRLNIALNRPKMGTGSIYLRALGGGTPTYSLYEIQKEGGVATWYTASLKEVLSYIEGLLDYNRRLPVNPFI